MLGWPTIAGFFVKHWLPLALVLGVLAWSVAMYRTGYRAAEREYDVATLQVEIDTLRADRALAEAARLRAEDERVNLEREAREDDLQIEALKELIRTRPADAGRGITQPELDGLLNIR